MKKSTNKNTVVWHVVVVALVTYISYSFRSDIVFSDVESLISILQNTSAMIFTIMGIWIAYVYPNAVLRVVQPSKASKVVTIFAEEDVKRVKLLVGVVVISACILALLVCGITIKVFLLKTEMYSQYTNVFTAIGLWWLLALTYAQLFCIYAVIASSVNFIIDLKNLQVKRKLSEKLDGKKVDANEN